MRARSILALILLSSCHRTVSLEPPPVNGVGSILLVEWDDGVLRAIYAIDIGDKIGSDYPTQRGGGKTAYASLTYGCPLHAMGFAQGSLPLLPKPVDVIRVPPPSDIHRSEFDGVAQSPWTEEVDMSDEVKGALLRIAVPEDNLCALFTVHFETDDATIQMPRTATSAAFGVTLPNRDVLMATLRGDFFRITESGSTPLPDLPRTLPHHAAYADPSGEIWLIGRDGTAAHGTIEGGFTMVAERADFYAAQNVRIAAPDPSVIGAPFELFVVSDARSFHRFDGQHWERISGGPPIPGDDRFVYRPSVAWLAPGEAMALGVSANADDDRVLVHYLSSTISMEIFPTQFPVPIEIADVLGYGPVMGTDHGLLAYRRDGSWKLVPGRALDGIVRVIAPVGQSLLIADLFGFAQYHPWAGYCEHDQYAVGYVRHVVPLGARSLLLLSRAENANEILMTRLVETSSAAACFDARRMGLFPLP